MDFFIINLLFSLVIVCNSDKNSFAKSATKLLNLKTDVNKIGEDLESLAFDIVEQVMAKANIFQVNGDYSAEDEVETPTETTAQHDITKTISENVENTTEEYTTEKSLQTFATLLGNSITTTKNVLEDFPKKRSKRSVDNNISEQVHVLKDQSSNCENSKCSEKTLKEQALEHQHIEDLKEEVNKLYDLVLLLRDQQKIISLLGEGATHVEDDLPKRFNAKNLLKILDHVSNKDMKQDKNSITGRKSAEIIIERDLAGKKATHEELENIKNDLRGAIIALNKTKALLAMQREKEAVLESQLQDQRLQINFLSAMVLRLYQNNTNYSLGFLPTKENFNIRNNEILGTPLHLPKELPQAKLNRKKVNEAHDKNNATTRESQSTGQKSRISEIQRENEDAVRSGSRASELEDLEKLLDEITKPKKSDVESKELELQKEKEKKKHDQDLLTQLILLQKLLARQKVNKNLNTESSSDSELLKRLEIAAEHMNKPESKLIDDDVELELKKLQDAINNRRPKDQWELIQDDRFQNERPKSDTEIIRKMLGKLLSNLETKGPQLSPKELEQLENPKILGGESTQIHFANDGSYPSNGYGYGPLGIFKRVPPFPSQLSNRWYGNGPYYPPFGGPQYQPIINRMFNNNYGMYGAPNNFDYNGYFAPTLNSYQDQNFGPYPYYRPPPFAPNQYNFDANIDSNTYGFYQKPFGNSIGPSPYNYGTGMEQNSYSSSDIYPNNQHIFGMNIDQSSSDGHQKPYVQSLPSNQYNFGTNLDQNSYQSTSDSHGSITGPSSYNKQLEQGKKIFPYSEGSKNSQSYKRTEIKNHFFPVYQQTGFQRPMPNAFYSQTNAAGESSSQSGAYSPHDTTNVDYRNQKVGDLKRQIYNLQNIINDLNKPDYTQKPEDKETVANLERQITELNAIINGLNQDMIPNKPTYLPSNPQSYEHQNNPQQQSTNYEKSSRRRRSLADNQIESDDDSKLYDQVVSKLKQFLFERDNETEERSSYDDVQRRIADLKYRLESHMETPKTGSERSFNPLYPTYGIQNTYQPPYYQYNSHYQYLPTKHDTSFSILPTKLTTKKTDVFTSIVLKILDKLLAATPVIIEKLFGTGLTKLINFGDDYSYGDNYGGYNAAYGTSNDIQNLFKSFGFLGYGPLIFLKIIDGFTTIVRILKKNKFFKTFLIPALVLLLVAGLVLCLIWWLQPDEDYYGYNHISQQSGYNYPNKNDGQYSNNNYQSNNNYYAPRSYNTPAYSRSYFENGQRSNFV